MSPQKFHDNDQMIKGVSNGSRSALLKINKDSHSIQKPSTSPTSSVSSSPRQPAFENSSHVPAAKHHKQQPQPVIIYTHAPKVITAAPCDFMALVQKLTGLSRSKEDEKTDKPETESIKVEINTLPEEKDCRGGNGACAGGGCVNNINGVYRDRDTDSSSTLTDERFEEDIKPKISPAVSSMYKVPSNSYLADAPIFAPNSTDFYCSSFKPNSMYQSPSMPNMISYMDYMKGFPDY